MSMGICPKEDREMLNSNFRRAFLITLLTTGFIAPALAQGNKPPHLGARWDVSLDLPVWPALSDLQPVAGGDFDTTGFGLGVSGHFPVAQFDNSELLIGGDLNFAATDSSIPVPFGDLLARQMYLGISAKWMFGKSRNGSLDAGIGYHEVDIAAVDSELWGTLEQEYWGKEKASAFIGATWDIGATRPNKNSGLFIGLRVHFVDFGSVHDGQYVIPRLGPDAGDLGGPLYVLRIGYSDR